MKPFVVLLLVALLSPAYSQTVNSGRTPTGIGAMQVALDQNVPIIRSYKLNSGEEISGETNDLPPKVRFSCLADGFNHDSTEYDARVDYTRKNTAGFVAYTGKLFWKKQPAADFSLTFALSGNRLNVTSQLLKENPGFQMLSVEMPAMVSVSGKESKLVVPTQSGRLVDVAKSVPHTQEILTYWVDPVRLAMACDEGALGMLSVNSLDDKLFAGVTSGSPNAGRLWMKFVHRLEAAKPELQFMAQDASTCTVTIIGKQKKQPPTWMDAAQLYREQIKAKTNPLYTGSFTYKIFCDGPSSERFTTFTDCLNLIKEVNAVTGGAKQIVYLVGWQHNGHDTGYPDVFQVNERLGGKSGLSDLISAAKAYNATVSLHDNYDDAYEDSPAWDDRFIARDSTGDRMRGGVWGGRQSYVISPLRYAVGAGKERIKRTAETYPIEKTIHIDVLSVEPGRCDFNAKRPSGAQRNLQGKLMIVEQFKQLGLDVTSEGFTSSFVGKISHFWHLLHKTDQVFSSEEPIPLIPYIFHAKASASDGVSDDKDLLRALLYGITASEDFTRDTPKDHITDLYYLVNLPWNKLADKEMSSYKRTGDTERVDYADGSYVEINTKKNTYTVVSDGSTVGKDFVATVPLDKSTIAVYSRKGGDVSFTAPKSWDGKHLEAYSLELDGTKKRVELGQENRTLSITTKAYVPYWVVAK